MHQKIRLGGWLLLAALLTLGVAVSLPTPASPCYGQRFDYYSTPALTEIVGSMIRCPGYPDQHDEDVNGNYVVTPWYTTSTEICPCPTGGGGGGGGGNQEDSDG